jgi:hypothetical protein
VNNCELFLETSLEHLVTVLGFELAIRGRAILQRVACCNCKEDHQVQEWCFVGCACQGETRDESRVHLVPHVEKCLPGTYYELWVHVK